MLVSIGLPTYNGARFIREGLECLLAQDYPDLEIVVSDNGSTDDTHAIATEYAEPDPRVRVIRQPTNIGSSANFNLVFRETSGPLFMWAADDDRWEPGYVSGCVRALEANPDAVLACTRLDFMGKRDAAYERNYDLFDNPDLSSGSVRRRVRDLLSRNGWYAIYGLIRRDTLAQTRLFTEGYGSDVVLLTELAMLGPFVRVDELLFHYRIAESRPTSRGPFEGMDFRVAAAPYTHLQERVSEAIGRNIPAWIGMAEAAFLRPTPLRNWIRDEVMTRYRMAVAQRNLRAIAKYGLLRANNIRRRLGPAHRSEADVG